MAFGRRTTDRRRRVLYSTQQADLETSSAAGRRTAEQWREARRPTAAFGARVHRRLRGRWFSLVPVKRRTLLTASAVLMGIALLLCSAHYIAVAWPSVANQPEIARPLRLDRPDSFGRWVQVMLLATSAGASLLIYQVRRYRIDDYTGQYRLWRLVLILLVLASVNSLVSVVDWSGAIMDVGFGKRVALSGNDWFRLVISIGGAVLCLRMVAEVRTSRWSLVTMITAWSFFAIPVAANWNFLNVDSLGKWTLVTCSPLIACTTLFISLGGYLRMLFRQVRNLDEHDSLSERFQEFKLRVFKRAEQEESYESEAESNVPDAKPRPRPAAAAAKAKNVASAEVEQADSDEAEDSANPPKSKRRWFGLRAAKPETDSTSDETATDETQDDEVEAAKEDPLSTPKRSRFSLGFLSRKKDSVDPQTDEEAVDDANSGRSPEPQRRSPEPQRQSTSRSPDNGRSDEAEQVGAKRESDEIDWDSLSKAERRRLRKQLKRQGRAA
ncbi:hypothetical protein CA13_48340 [Planctomycetes bacterium CA13]|uniref:Uncharacterized protein n=1 Tax=Novipirellula herctigrandis TaxID=2527986 RepID=A0A5C5Z7P3_9BACT|nr:hypothetical protein CA13_48340 [Planctomycetes bacterium CA13]